MAKLRSLIGSMSGKVGGMVYSHNRYGDYVRALKIPTNPNTGRQSRARASLGGASGMWGDLDPAERSGWETLAAAVQFTGRNGTPVTLNGAAAFSRMNALAMNMNSCLATADYLDLMTVAPLAVNYTGPDVVAVSNQTIAIPGVDAWVTALKVDVTNPANPRPLLANEYLVWFTTAALTPGRTAPTQFRLTDVIKAPTNIYTLQDIGPKWASTWGVADQGDDEITEQFWAEAFLVTWQNVDATWNIGYWGARARSLCSVTWYPPAP